MRIAYVTLHLGPSILNGGVGKKIQTQISLWKSAGHQVHLFLHSPEKIEIPGSTLFLFEKKIPLSIIGSISKEFSRIQALSNLIRAVRNYQPDIIYLRYGLFTIPLQELFSIAPVVVEINTLDQQEYRYRGEIYYWMNRVGRQIILSNAAGFNAASEEIAVHPTNIHFKKSTIVISNGIELSNYEVLPPTHNIVPRLVFIGTPGYPWHGVDKIIEFAILKPDIHIDIIGYSKNDLKMEKIPENVTCYGFLQSHEYKKIFSTCDAAIGTLALHRKYMEEASPLKVREYLIYGLPVIIGYWDTDLSNRRYDFVCQIPNTENNIQEYFEQICSFVYQMMGKRVDRNIIAPLIDQRIKEVKRLEFFAQILGK